MENKKVNSMYKKLYYLLFNKITDALDAQTAYECRKILEKAQQEAEDILINSNEEI